MQMRSRTSRTNRSRPSQVIQRKAAPVVAEESELPPPSISAQLQAARRGHSLSTMSVGTSMLLQAKLMVNQPGDICEQEAELVATQVMHQPTELDGSSALADTASTPSLQVQRTAVAAEAPVPDAAERDISQMQGGGQALPDSERSFFEQRFGHDFSQVRIHADSHAAKTSRSLNARAFTVGNDIAFDAGEYQPGTSGGRHLLAHELTHVVQQGGAGQAVQRLIRTPYPWKGVILPADGVELQDTPKASKPAGDTDTLAKDAVKTSHIIINSSTIPNKATKDTDKPANESNKPPDDTIDQNHTIKCIPQGQIVNVLSSSGDFLQIEASYEGKPVTGYTEHTNVDDATAHSMEASVGTRMVWNPSGPKSGTDFEQWASAATETPFPAITSSTVMNCWESVLLAAYKAGAIDWKWIHRLYTSVPPGNWADTMSRGSLKTYQIPGPNQTMPQRGDIVFFDGINHVALATGNGSDIFTFWPPPDTPFQVNGTPDRVKVFTIEALVNYYQANKWPEPKVEFGAPSW